jgi:hypothetical protein
MNKVMKKGIGMFLSFILVMATISFSISLSSEEVKAANVDTCGLTEDGNYCVEVPHGAGWDEYGGCVSGHEWQYKTKEEVSECKTGVCIPSSMGACLENVEKVRCINEQAGSFREGVSKESVPECSLGCCIEYGSCSLQEKKVCLNDRGGEFKAGITDRQQCNLECAGAVLGCYKRPEGGKCEYGALEKFKDEPDFNSANFFSNTYCRDVVGCPSYREGHAYKSCGDGTTDDDVWDVYWYDKEGNREELAEECGVGYMCNDPDDRIGGLDASCLSTKCVDDSPNTWPSEFKSGESICMNVLSGFFANDRRSKGLHNYRLICQNREIKPDYQDENRGKRCVESVTEYDNVTRIEANWVDNEWQRCKRCGKGGLKGFDDMLNYAPGFGQFLANLFGEQCTSNGGWFGNQPKCQNFGDCGGGPLLAGDNYDSDLWAPIGSCNPLYPPGEDAPDYGDPGSRCGECGKGGDGLVNVCTEFECNAMGDCQFKPDPVTGGMLSTAALALGTYASSIALCQLVSWLPGGFKLSFLCGTGMGSAFASLSGEGLLYWGVVSTLYGREAAQETGEEDIRAVDDVKMGGKTRLGYALLLGVVGKELEKISDEEARGSPPLFGGPIGLDGAEDLISSGPHGMEALLEEDESLPGKKAAQAVVNSPATNIFKKLWGRIKGLPSGLKSKVKGFYDGLKGKSNMLKGVGPYLIAAAYLAMFFKTSSSFKTGKCVPEGPYKTSEHCLECGALEGQWYCTKERCDILGGKSGYCKFLPFEEGGTESGLCLPKDPDDRSSPVITSVEIDFRDKNGDILQGPYKGRGKLEISEKIKWNTAYSILKINTSEIAGGCKYSFERSMDYENMESFPWAVSTGREVNISFDIDQKVRDNTYIYIKCEDLAGNVNQEDNYYVKFSFEEAPDRVEPIIDYIDPNNVNLPEDVDNLDIVLYAYDNNRVDDCRYSKSNETLNYEDMVSFGNKIDVRCSQTDETCQKFEKSFNLNDQGWCQDVSVGEINGTYVGLNTSICPLYIKCKDTKGNIMSDPFIWSAVRWKKFDLDIIKPDEGFETYDDKFEIELRTSTEAICKYKFDDAWYNLSTRYTRIHSGIHENLVGDPSGIPYNILFECSDFAGNIVEGSRTIVAYRDTDAPVLLRVWTTSMQLHILVDEESVCKYSDSEREFDFEDSENVYDMIATSDGREHYASLGERVYYIKCKDKWGNENPSVFTVYPR